MEKTEKKGNHKACLHCKMLFLPLRRNMKYCNTKCRNDFSNQKSRRKKRFESVLSGFKLRLGKKSVSRASRIDYVRLTFILSLMGFLGSIGFYLGVLSEVYSPAGEKQKIEVLQQQNDSLQRAVIVLIKREAEND